jgi:type IV pilus modification protein PilV
MRKTSPIVQGKAASGFSLIEFLLAAFIMSIGLLGLIALQTMALAQTGNARGRTTASYIASGILQRAQAEGQQSYFAKLNSTTVPAAYVAVFTANSGNEIAETTFGGFNVDGVQVTDDAGANVANLATAVPDANKRRPMFTASWMRRGYLGTVPAVGAQSQELVVNVTWVEHSVSKALSMSRVIRY